MSDIVLDNPKCRARHLGLWAIEAQWFRQAVEAVQAGIWAAEPVRQQTGNDYSDFFSPDAQLLDDGVLVVQMTGPMMKGDSKYGGVNTVRARQLMRQAAQDDAVKGALLVMDSPGGTFDGTMDLANAVRQFGTTKPLHAYVSSQSASANYWVAAQAPGISAGRDAFVGSIGTYTYIEDSSDRAARLGIKVHLISSGGVKGATVPGVPVSDAALEHVQAQVDAANDIFVDGVMTGRAMTREAVEAIADGRIHIAANAQQMGLIDHVEDSDTALSRLRDTIATKAAEEDRAARRQQRERYMRRARLG